MPKAFWTEARTERAVALWFEGLSGAQIGKALGCPRNAVVGKLFRLGLKRSDEQRRVAQAHGAVQAARLRTVAPEPLRIGRRRPPELEPEPFPEATPVDIEPKLLPLVALTRTSCRWPYDLADGGIGFCGHRRAPARPYCPAHQAVAIERTAPPLTLERLDPNGRLGLRPVPVAA